MTGYEQIASQKPMMRTCALSTEPSSMHRDRRMQDKPNKRAMSVPTWLDPKVIQHQLTSPDSLAMIQQFPWYPLEGIS